MHPKARKTKSTRQVLALYSNAGTTPCCLSVTLYWLLQKQKKSKKGDKTSEERRLKEAKKVLKKGLARCLACNPYLVSTCPCFPAVCCCGAYAAVSPAHQSQACFQPPSSLLLLYGSTYHAAVSTHLLLMQP